MQAGILERPTGDTDLSRHIFADQHLTEEQRQALMRIYLSFRHENEDHGARGEEPGPDQPTEGTGASADEDGPAAVAG